MHLTKDEEKILDGDKGEVMERLFRLLVRLGEIYGADKMIPVGSVQVAGVSYKSIGDPGTEFLEDMASKNAKVKVLTYLNPAGMDLENWKEYGFPADFAKKRRKLHNQPLPPRRPSRPSLLLSFCCGGGGGGAGVVGAGAICGWLPDWSPLGVGAGVGFR